jgi:hypothetical protein
VKAIAIANGDSASTAASAAYTITPLASMPSVSPASGTYPAAQTVTISTATPSATIYYTTNGSTPTASSSIYSGPIMIAATETLQAMAMASGYSASPVRSAAYTITPTTTAPTFSPAGGTYASAQAVKISTTLSSATIYYTTNGSNPTTSSPIYSGPIMVAASETIKAMAAVSTAPVSRPRDSKATFFSTSAVSAATYVVTAAAPTFSVTVSPASLTVPVGHSATTTVLIAPQNGFASAVSFSCSGLPAGTSCRFSPTPVTPSGEVASAVLTVTSSAASAAQLQDPSPSLPGAALAAAILCFGWKRRRGMQLFLLAAVAVGLGLCTGCGVYTPPAAAGLTSTVAIIATDGYQQPSATLTLTMQ